MDGFGNFVVAWRQTQLNGDTNVLAQRFNASGVPIGGNVQVGAGTFMEHDPSVAMDNFGDFIVAYVRDTNNNNPDVFAKRYDINNNLLNVVNVATTSFAEINPSIAMTPDGRFDIAWERAFSSSDHDIFVSRYAPSTAFLGTDTIDVSGTNASHPSISMNVFGDAVVAYEFTPGLSRQILAKRVGPNGGVGAPITIASSSFLLGSLHNPSVAMKRFGTSFVVAYESDPLFFFSTRVRVTEVAPNNSIFANFDAGSSRFTPAVSINGAGQYLLTYTSNDSGDLNIRRRIGRLTI
jgi:hypothetical protein